MWAFGAQEWHSLLFSALTPDFLRALVSLPCHLSTLWWGKGHHREKEVFWLRGASQSWRKADCSRQTSGIFPPTYSENFIVVLGDAWNCSRYSERHRDTWDIVPSHSFIKTKAEHGWLCPHWAPCASVSSLGPNFLWWGLVEYYFPCVKMCYNCFALPEKGTWLV